MTSSSQLVRDRLPTLPIDKSDGSCGQFTFLHPGYPEAAARLLTLEGRDSVNGDIAWYTAYTACAIIANNAFNGFFSKSRAVDAEPLQQTHLLSPGTYYFHVPYPDSARPETDARPNTDAYRWPVVADFRSWDFPEKESIPGPWRTPSNERPGNTTSGRCIMTDQTVAVDDTHIIPSTETDWFFKNEMIGYFDYEPGSSLLACTIDNPCNTIPLRTDIHRLFDAKQLAFVPKHFDEGEDQYQVATHCFVRNEEVVAWYHNRRSYRSDLPREYFLARLAWIILEGSLNKMFLVRGVERYLHVRDSEGQASDQTCSAARCRQIALTKNKSTSPKKRKATGGDKEEDSGDDTREPKRLRTRDSFDSGIESDQSDERHESDDGEEIYGEPAFRGRTLFREYIPIA